MPRLRAFLAASAIVVCGVFATPAAALGSTIYPPSQSCTAAPTTLPPGGTTSLACDAATFSASEDVTITVTGEDGRDAVVGMVKFAPSTASGAAVAEPDGSLAAVEIRFPSSARGTYNIAAFSATSAGGTAAVTVTNADGSIPATGLDGAALTGVWIGGGILLVGGAALVIVGIVRRERDARF